MLFHNPKSVNEENSICRKKSDKMSNDCCPSVIMKFDNG
jgi:hypothetical protein